MTTQFPTRYTTQNTSLTTTTPRPTAVPTRPFSSLLHAGADAVITGAEAAARRLPGGPLISAAVRTPEATGSSPLDPGHPAASSAVAGNAPDSLESVVQAQAEHSMYYLQLQQQIQEETRTYSTLSNVLKARHDTVKNAIGNLR